MNLNSLNVPGLTDLNDNSAEKCVGGKFNVVFISTNGERTVQRTDGSQITLDIPNDIAKIRVRNRDANRSNFVADYTDEFGNFNPGDTFSLDPQSATRILQGSTVRNLDGRDFTPNQVTIQQQAAT